MANNNPALLELPELLVELRLATQKGVIDIDSGEKLYQRAKASRAALAEAGLEGESGFAELNSAIIAYYTVLCEEKRKREADAVYAHLEKKDEQKDAERERALVRENEQITKEQEAENKRRAARRKRVVFNLAYGAVSLLLVGGLFVLKYTVSHDALKDGLQMTFGLLGCAIGLLGGVAGFFGGLLAGVAVGLLFTWLLGSIAGNVIAAIGLGTGLYFLWRYLSKKKIK
jgi:Fe2+ transport system protein B